MNIKKLIGKTNKTQKILDQLTEKRPLPLGVTDFHKWADRIIDGAMIGADRDSQKFALADMILHLSATEDHKEDGYFIKVLRKTAVNQVADSMRNQIRDAAKARLAAEAKAKADIEAVLEQSYVPPQVSELADEELVTSTAKDTQDVLEKQKV